MIDVEARCVICCQPSPDGLQCEHCRTGSAIPVANQLHTPLAPFPGRVTITLPWSALASDNLRKGVVGSASREKQARYDEALAFARSQIREQYQGEPTEGPVRVTATFYVPDNVERDPTNFIKLILDALQKLIVTKDTWLVVRESRWVTAGVDRDRPRCEIVIERIQ